jgi:hypothetical protein
MRGAGYGLKSGDTLKASIVGNAITVSINGVQKARVTDDTFKTGNPGIGEFLACDGGQGIGTNADFGFASFTARGIGKGDQRGSLSHRGEEGGCGLSCETARAPCRRLQGHATLHHGLPIFVSISSRVSDASRRRR